MGAARRGIVILLVLANVVLASLFFKVWTREQILDSRHIVHHSENVYSYHLHLSPFFVRSDRLYDNNASELTLYATPPILGTEGEATEGLFDQALPGNKAQRIITQLSWLATTSREGALFDVIGRRKV